MNHFDCDNDYDDDDDDYDENGVGDGGNVVNNFSTIKVTTMVVTMNVLLTKLMF